MQVTREQKLEIIPSDLNSGWMALISLIDSTFCLQASVFFFDDDNVQEGKKM